MALFTDTKRCYRLTKQAFVNITYGLSLQSGLTSQATAPAPAPYKWKKNDSAANNNDWRNSRVDNYNSQKGNNHHQPQNQVNNNGNRNTVSQFFSAYRHPNKSNISKISQVAKQDQDLSKSMANISLAPSWPMKTVDAEFQAMWSQLQKAPPNPPGSTANVSPPSSVISPMAVSEQTNALKKFLKIKGGESPQKAGVANIPNVPPNQCTHKGMCAAELVIMCKRMGTSYDFIQNRDRTTGEVSTELCFSDGIKFFGPKCRNKTIADQLAACMAVREYPSILASKLAKANAGMRGGPPGMPIQTQGVPFPFTKKVSPGMMVPGVRPPQNLMTQAPPRVSGPPGMIPAQSLLPNPPQQWCQQPPAGPAKSKSNPFVPLQAQTAAMNAPEGSKPQQHNQQPTGMTGERMNKDVVRPIPQSPKKKTPEQPASTSAERQQPQSRKQRRARIAAKFSTPLQN